MVIQNFKSFFDGVSGLKILVIGDLILDEYIWGQVFRISPEAPVPIVTVDHLSYRLGGAGNVASNIESLGGYPILCGVLGDDREGQIFRDIVEHRKMGKAGICTELSRWTSKKTRIIAHSQQVVRLDRESNYQIELETYQQIKQNLSRLTDCGIKAIVISDYNKGVISSDLMRDIREFAAGIGAPIISDPKGKNMQLHKYLDLITPSYVDAAHFCHVDPISKRGVYLTGLKLLGVLKCGSVLLTQGSLGMTLFKKEPRITETNIPAVAKEVSDVTGAGDTVSAVMALGLGAGLDMENTAILANVAAGIVVGKVGTSTASMAELEKALSREIENNKNKA